MIQIKIVLRKIRKNKAIKAKISYFMMKLKLKMIKKLSKSFTNLKH